MQSTYTKPPEKPTQESNPIQVSPDPDAEDVLIDLAPGFVLLLVLFGFVVAIIAISIAQPDWITATIDSFDGTDGKAFWYLSRASGVVAYLLLWASMGLGLAITNRIARVWPGGPTLNALHEYTSLLGLGFTLFHALILLGDGYTPYSIKQILVPFAADNYRPFWVRLGQVGFYLSLLVTGSFYLRRQIGQHTWRALHYLSFAGFALALVHGLTSGTDSNSSMILDLYWTSAVTIIGLIAYRVLLAMQPKTALQ